MILTVVSVERGRAWSLAPFGPEGGKDMSPEPILQARDLRVAFPTPQGQVRAVDGISYDLRPGEILGVVGESGSGKSVQAYSLLGLVPAPGRVTGGSVRFHGEEVLTWGEAALRRLRGDRIGMIFQNPMTSLNPVYPVGRQLMEAYRCHRKASRQEARRRAVDMLRRVGLSDPETRLGQYPHQLSGGMRQRVMIAMGLICDPELLIADEPTTALDATIQAQILELICDLQAQNGMAVLFITHDLGVVAQLCHRVCVMYAGRFLEEGETAQVLRDPRHPYTRGLLDSLPSLEDREAGPLTCIAGSPPNPLEVLPGCPFAPRCPRKLPVCDERFPPWREEDRRRAACWRWERGAGE